MAGHKRKRANRQKMLLTAAVVVLVIVIVLITALTTVVKKYAPSNEQTDYAAFYQLQDEDDMMICVNHTVLEETGLLIDGEVYLPYSVVSGYLNSRFFWDGTEQILRYTLPEGILNVSGETADYVIGREAGTAEHTILHIQGDQMYLSLSFVEQYTNIRSEIFENPNRVVISDTWGTVDYTEIKRGTEVREKGGIKSPVLTEAERGDLVTVLEEMDSWSEICTEDGFVGYVKNSALGGSQSIVYEENDTEPEFPHISREDTVNMAWHQVTNQTANRQIDSVLASTKGVNVISPTWFYLDDNEGGIASLASTDYVSYCHENGVEVWGLISNLENADVDTTQVLNVTSSRDTLVNNLVAEAVKYDLDGINVDFEMITEDCSRAYIEFIRELSIMCRINGIVLSVDNYVPTASSDHYSRDEQGVFADYVIIMGYDEHYAGSEEAGSVASYSFVENGIQKTLEEVPAEKVINAVPFYTRFWKTDADGTVTSEALGMDSADERLANNGAEAVWDEETRQYYAEFEYEGSTYQIWLEEERSIEEKMTLIREYNLAGVASWRLGYERSTIWDVILRYVN